MNASADSTFEDLVRLLEIIERAIEKTEDPESLVRIDVFVGCLSFPVLSSFRGRDSRSRQLFGIQGAIRV